MAAAEAEEGDDPASLIVEGKRRRARVDYAQMAAELLVDGLLPEEGDEGDWSPS